MIKFAGIIIKDICMSCGYLNPQFNDFYRCCCKGSCPHYLAQEQKDELIATWDQIKQLNTVKEYNEQT
jgi:hypothetical protein